MIGQQLEIQPDLPDMLRFVDDQRTTPADEGRQFSQRLTLQVLPDNNILPRDEQGVGIVFPDVTPDQRGFAHSSGTINHNDFTRCDQVDEPGELRLRNVNMSHNINTINVNCVNKQGVILKMVPFSEISS